ncbi:peptidase inhibitor family I36 protein [Streptomyces sp. NPDC002054]|uniref:peptidase inhibitor family I36 protein n=1 Tax=Streptomyces sp. NPDC002054 TaxID=3154663 RepID=UPI00331A970A
MAMRRFFLQSAAGAAALIGFIGITATPASATVFKNVGRPGQCYQNYVCLWASPNYQDDGSWWPGIASDQNIGDMGKIQAGAGMQDTASSIKNNTGRSICFYEHNWYGGNQFRIGPWEQWATVPGWIDNKISSFKFC